ARAAHRGGGGGRAGRRRRRRAAARRDARLGRRPRRRAGGPGREGARPRAQHVLRQGRAHARGPARPLADRGRRAALDPRVPAAPRPAPEAAARAGLRGAAHPAAVHGRVAAQGLGPRPAAQAPQPLVGMGAPPRRPADHHPVPDRDRPQATAADPPQARALRQARPDRARHGDDAHAARPVLRDRPHPLERPVLRPLRARAVGLLPRPDLVRGRGRPARHPRHEPADVDRQAGERRMHPGRQPGHPPARADRPARDARHHPL
ncbi:MAG: hypothetical protein AVDCRST_MAG30-4538, partial [uncultured Solirubrobacteraceae bacterium]